MFLDKQLKSGALSMQTSHNENIDIYKTLDKDYGRVFIVGPGYGEFNLEEYEKLETLVK
jgi:hypothetical protein